MKRTFILLSLLTILSLSACEVFLNEHGGDGQSCFGDGSCNAGYTCTAGVCRPTSFVCDEQQSGCDGSWTTDCQSNKWVRITDCSVGDKICKDAACSYVPIDGDADVELPTDPCTNGDLRCMGTLKLVCEGSSWRAVTDCFDLGKSCENGKCVAALDGDADKDADGREDAESESDSEGERDSELDTDKETEADGDPDADVDSDTPTEKESESEADADTDAKETEREAEEDKETETEPEPEADTEAEIEVGTDCTTEPCCENGYWLIENAACVSGAAVPDCALEECAASHACLPTRKAGACLIDGVCAADGALDTQGCRICQASTNSWQPKSANESCDDQNACTYHDYCDGAGQCVGTAILCPANADTCGEQNRCQGTDSCLVYTPGAETACDDRNACTYNDACNGGGMCQGTAISCTNDAGACGTKRTCNGTNHCTEVRPGPTTACEADGLACTNDVCNGMGTCVHTPKAGYCVIAGVCHPDRAANPDNACQWCDASLNAWANKPTTEGCNDGLDCTYDDRCDGSGSCGGTYLNCEDEPGPCGAKKACQGTSECKYTYPTTSTSCDDGAACTKGDVCNGLGGCGGTTYECTTPGSCEKADGATCNGDGTCTYTADLGATCNDGNLCTTNDQCQANKTCAGTTYSCNGHGSCNGKGCTCNAGFGGTYCDQCGLYGFGTYPNCPVPSQSYCQGYQQCFKVPPTKQTKCYNDYDEIACPGIGGQEACGEINNCGQDAQYPDNARTYTCYNSNGIATECALLPVASKDEVVVDSITGLMWQRQIPSSYSNCSQTVNCTWTEATNICADLQYGGYSDWRMPSVYELNSLIADNSSEVLIDDTAFPGTPKEKFWTSSGYMIECKNYVFGYKQFAVGFGTGSVWSFLYAGECSGVTVDYAYVRCVRGGVTGTGSGTFKRYLVSGSSGAEVSYDSITGLIWQNTSASGLNWRQSLAYCESLIYAGQTDWRLPNKKELLSIGNEFSLNPLGTYWSSTSVSQTASKAWKINYFQGRDNSSAVAESSTLDKASPLYVRCVRGGP